MERWCGFKEAAACPIQSYLMRKALGEIDGEGYFEVFPNKDKPFLVQSGTLEAEVLGTSFNVKAFDQLTEKVISLVEGRLAVRAVDTAGLVGAEVVLAAGEVALFNNAKNTIEKK